MKNNNLFNGEILDDNQSWQGFVRSPEAFTPLIKHIYQINNLKLDEIFYITVASNAVFRIGDKVIKIFYPPEAGFRYMLDCEIYEYKTELAVMNFAKNAGILTPEIICNGIVQDKRYSFGYIVMNFIDGISAENAIKGFDDKEKREFVLKFKEMIDKLHVKADIDIPRFDEPERLNHVFWNNMPELFREDRKRYLANANFPEAVITHGDLSGANIIIDKQGCINLLDFAESKFAPYYCDKCCSDDPVIIETYYGGYYKSDEFYDNTTMAELLNWWAGNSIQWQAESMGIDFATITSVNALKNMIIKRIERRI